MNAMLSPYIVSLTISLWLMALFCGCRADAAFLYVDPMSSIRLPTNFAVQEHDRVEYNIIAAPNSSNYGGPPRFSLKVGSAPLGFVQVCEVNANGGLSSPILNFRLSGVSCQILRVPSATDNRNLAACHICISRVYHPRLSLTDHDTVQIVMDNTEEIRITVENTTQIQEGDAQLPNTNTDKALDKSLELVFRMNTVWLVDKLICRYQIRLPLPAVYDAMKYNPTILKASMCIYHVALSPLIFITKCVATPTVDSHRRGTFISLVSDVVWILVVEKPLFDWLVTEYSLLDNIAALHVKTSGEHQVFTFINFYYPLHSIFDHPPFKWIPRYGVFYVVARGFHRKIAMVCIFMIVGCYCVQFFPFLAFLRFKFLVAFMNS